MNSQYKFRLTPEGRRLLWVVILCALVIALAWVLTPRTEAAQLAGTLGCKAYTGRCLISADGLGQAASTLCEDGRHFAGADVWAGRVFDPEHYYTVKGCADGATGIKNVRIGAKWR